MQQIRGWSFALALLLPAAALAQTPAPAPAAPAPASGLPAATAAPGDARVYFITPRNGERIRGPITVRFGLKNMGVTRAGDKAPNVGHHHLLIDVKEPIVAGEPLPTDKSHLHFGGGQTETQIELTPGRHTLQLVLGDADHRPFSPIVQSDKIQIVVVTGKQRPHKRRYRRR